MTELPHLNAIEARVLGCLMEKQLLTPDVYPLTLNALQSAANQKTSREPVMALEPTDISRTFRSLEDKGLARRMMASRVDRYEQTASREFSLTSPQCALLAILLLRGPQTLNELQTRTERMANFRSADAVSSELDMLIGRHPPLVIHLDRAPGQREDRYAHLLSGEVEVPVSQPAVKSQVPSVSAIAELEDRVRKLEAQLADLEARLQAAGA